MTPNTLSDAADRNGAVLHDRKLKSMARLRLLTGVGIAALLTSAAPIGGAWAEVTINDGGSEIVDGGTQSTPWNIGGNLVIGSVGEGALTIRNGGKVINATGTVGRDADSDGVVTVTGAESTWTNEGNLQIGYEGTGDLTISDGAEVVVRYDSHIGKEVGSDGSVTVTGADSEWFIWDKLSVGGGGTGELTISDGGLVDSFGAVIESPDHSRSRVTVTGNDSTWSNTGSFDVGSSGVGELTVSDGGQIIQSIPSNNILIADNNESTGIVNIGAAAGDTAVAPGTLVTDGVEFGQGDGTLVFNHTGGNYNFAPKISGEGKIDVYSGTTLLTGTSSDFAGTATVHGGRLSIFGTLAGDINVGSGGVLRGTGTVGSLDVSGFLAPGNSVGTLTTTGDATFNAGSTYRVYVDRNGASRLDVGGTATIDGGTVDVVSLETDDDQSILGTYTILEADSRTGEFDDVSANFAFIDPSLSYDDTHVFLTLALRELPQPDPDPDPESDDGTTLNPPMKHLQTLFAGNANQQELVAILDSLDTTDPRYQAFSDAFGSNAFFRLSPEAVATVLEELSGSRSAGVSGISASFSTGLMDFVQMANGFGGGFGQGGQTAAVLTPGTIQFASAEPMSRDEWDEVAQAPAPAGAGRTDGPASWVRIVGQTGRQGSANGMPGSDSRSAGLHAGIDMPVNDAFSVGAAVGYEQGRVTSGGMLGIDTESYSGAVYGRYQLDDLRLSGAFSYSRIDYDSNRTVPVFGLQTAEYSADAWNVDAQAAYDFRPGPDGLTISPLVGIRYLGMRQEGYEETGDAGLSVGSLTTDSVRARLGAETRFESAMDDGMTVALTARAAWSREIGSPETALRASLLGSDSFAIQGQGLPRDIAELGVTLDLGMTNNVDLFAAYDGSLGDNYTDHRGQAGLRFTW